MRLIFMGTAEFAVPSLERLAAAGHEIAAVFTQPDRPQGRGYKLQPSPVKQSALALGVEIVQPDSLGAEPVRERLAALDPEMVVVVAYGRIIPEWLRRRPRLGVVNLHGSILPKYRGAAPIHRAIANGETRTGVCVMEIDEGLDTGPVYACLETEIDPDETAPELSRRLADLGAGLLVRTVDQIGRGAIRPRPQNHAEASRAPRLRKEDGYIRWSEPAQTIHNRVRGFTPWPGVIAGFRGRSCLILESRVGEAGGAAPGSIVFEGGRLKVGCGDGRFLEILRLRMESRKAVTGADFVHGMRVAPGECFTPAAA